MKTHGTNDDATNRLPVVHIAPTLRDDCLGVSVINTVSAHARGGTLLLDEAAARALPALLRDALDRYDAQQACARGRG